MTPNAGNPQQLESLVTRIYMDASNFMAGAAAIETRTAQLAGEMASIGTSVSQIGVALVQQLGGIAGAVAQIGQAFSGITFGNFAQQASAVNINLSGMQTALAGLSDQTALKNFDNAVIGLAASFGKLTAANDALVVFRLQLEALVTWMTNAGKDFPKAATELARSFGRLGGFLDSVKNLATTSALKDLPKELSEFIAAMPTDISKVVNMGKALRSIGNAVTAFTKLSPGGLLPVVNGLKDMVIALNAIPPVNSNVMQLGQTLGQIGAGMKGLAGRGVGGAGGGPGKGGGWFGGLLGGLGAVPPAAAGASRSLGGLGYDMMRLQGASDNVGASLITLRYGLAGLGILGAFQFSRLDEALARTSAHARDFARGNTAEMTRGVFGVSGRSTSSATELAKALDGLTTAGLSATSAVRGLPLVEDFAVSAGLKASDAAKRITDLMHAMNYTGGSSVEFLTNMRNLSDMLVGVARNAGTTEEKLMEGFTSRFLVAAQKARLEMQESVAILGLLSREGEGFRGAKGGNLAARAIVQISDEAVFGRKQWEEMLGVEAYDKATGKIKPFVDLLVSVKKRMAEVGTNKFTAELEKLKIGGTETTFAVVPLFKIIGGVKDLRKEMELLTGISKATADTIRTSMQSQLLMLWNNLSNTAAVVGMHLAPALYMLTKPLSQMLFAFTMLNPAIQNFIVWTGVAIAMFGPLRSSLFWLVGLALSPLTNLAAGIYNIAASVVSLTYSIGVGLYQAVTKTFSYMVTGLANLALFFHRVGKGVVDLFTGIGSLFIDVSKNMAALGTALTVMVVNVLNGLLGLLVTVGAVVAAFALLPLILATIAAPLVTVGIGIAQLIGVIGVGLVKAWDAMKASASSALNWVGAKVEEINAGTSALWNTLRESTVGLFRDMVTAGAVIVGFMWNIRENARIIFDWLSKHGVKPFEDIAAAAFEMVETAGTNFMLLMRALGGSAVVLASSIWDTLTNVFGAVTLWITEEWTNMFADLNKLVFAFIGNLAKNWTVLEKLFNELKQIEVNRAVNKWLAPAGAEEDPEAIARMRTRAIEKAMRAMKGPFDDFDTSKLETNFSALGELLMETITGPASQKIWARFARQTVATFADAFENMNPIFGAFKRMAQTDIWKELFGELNFKVPDMKEAGDLFRKAMGLTEKGEGTAPSIENLSGSFSLKQSSQQRFMFGGQEVVSIQHQQLLELRGIRRELESGRVQRGPNVTNNNTTLTSPPPMPRLD